MKNEEGRLLRVTLRRMIAEESRKVLSNKDPELYLLTDERLAEGLTNHGFPISQLAVYYHRTLLGIPRMATRWQEYQRQIVEEERKANAKKKVRTT